MGIFLSHENVSDKLTPPPPKPLFRSELLQSAIRSFSSRFLLPLLLAINLTTDVTFPSVLQCRTTYQQVIFSVLYQEISFLFSFLLSMNRYSEELSPFQNKREQSPLIYGMNGGCSTWLSFSSRWTFFAGVTAIAFSELLFSCQWAGLYLEPGLAVKGLRMRLGAILFYTDTFHRMYFALANENSSREPFC